MVKFYGIVPGKVACEFPSTIKQGDIITHPDGGESYKVVKTPRETGQLSCEVRQLTGKKKNFYQFAYIGLLINGKPISDEADPSIEKKIKLSLDCNPNDSFEGYIDSEGEVYVTYQTLVDFLDQDFYTITKNGISISVSSEDREEEELYRFAKDNVVLYRLTDVCDKVCLIID